MSNQIRISVDLPCSEDATIFDRRALVAGMVKKLKIATTGTGNENKIVKNYVIAFVKLNQLEMTHSKLSRKTTSICALVLIQVLQRN